MLSVRGGKLQCLGKDLSEEWRRGQNRTQAKIVKGKCSYRSATGNFINRTVTFIETSGCYAWCLKMRCMIFNHTLCFSCK